ncbi:unnamed protein product [Boreogadus saida]
MTDGDQERGFLMMFYFLVFSFSPLHSHHSLVILTQNIIGGIKKRMWICYVSTTSLLGEKQGLVKSTDKGHFGSGLETLECVVCLTQWPPTNQFDFPTFKVQSVF